MIRFSFSELILMHEISGKLYLDIINAKYANESGDDIEYSNNKQIWLLNSIQKDAIEDLFTSLQSKCENANVAVEVFYSKYLPLHGVAFEFQKDTKAAKIEFQPSCSIFSINGKKALEFNAKEWKFKKDAIIKSISNAMYSIK